MFPWVQRGRFWNLHSWLSPQNGSKKVWFLALEVSILQGRLSVSLPEGYLDSFFPGSRIDPIRKLWVFKWKSRSYLHSLAFYQHHRIHGTGTYIYLRENHKFGPNVGSKYTVRPMAPWNLLMCWCADRRDRHDFQVRASSLLSRFQKATSWSLKFQPHLKNMRKSKWVHLPQFSAWVFHKKCHLSCHHPRWPSGSTHFFPNHYQSSPKKTDDLSIIHLRNLT